MLDFLKINLSNNIAIFIIIIMFFFCVLSLVKNKKLTREIEELKLELKPNIKIEKNLSADIVPIKTISKEQKNEKICSNKTDNLIIKQSKEQEEPSKLKIVKQQKNKKTELPKQKIELYQNEYQPKQKQPSKISKKEPIKQPYTKNILQNTSKATSPVTLNKENIELENKFNLNEFIPKEHPHQKCPPQTTTQNYLQEVSRQMANELKPQTISLTDYERAEEDNAIISYKELLNVKDKMNAITDEDETIDFIEELKKLRNSLN